MDTKIKLYLTQKEVDALYLITGKIGGNNHIRDFFYKIRKELECMVSKEVYDNYMNNRTYYCQGVIRTYNS